MSMGICMTYNLFHYVKPLKNQEENYLINSMHSPSPMNGNLCLPRMPTTSNQSSRYVYLYSYRVHYTHSSFTESYKITEERKTREKHQLKRIYQ